MDLVLGLSLTSASVRWVLVEGTTGEGDPIDRGELDIPEIDELDADLLLRAVLNPDVVAGNHIRVVGVTATADAARAASAVVDALEARGHHDVALVSDTAAVAALASGIAAITEYHDVAVCIVEPESAFVAMVDGGEVTVEDVDRPSDGADAIEPTSSVIAPLEGRQADAIFVIGSGDVDVVVASFEVVTEAPVFSAAEADLAMARGAALVAGRTLDMSGPAAGPVRGRASRTGVLVAVLAAAVVTFVVSLSFAIGISLTRDTPPQNEKLSAASEPEQSIAPTAAAPRPITQPLVAFPDASRDLAKTMVVRAPPPPPIAVPVYAPPPAAPPPVYQAPPPPVYVPPPAPPRLRDRIIERIPIIGRFHEPGQ